MNLSKSEQAPENERAARLRARGIHREIQQQKIEQESERREVVGTAPVTRLLRRFESESRRYHRRMRGAIRLVLGGAALVTLVDGLAIVLAARHGMATLPFGFILITWLLYGLTLCTAPIPVLRSRRARDLLRDRLSGYDDIRVIGPLAEMLCDPDPILHGAAVEALTRLLPRLRRADAPLISAEQRDCLSSVLRGTRREEIDLAIEVLKAFAEVGKDDVLPLVERLAEMTVRSRRHRAVRAAAIAALPPLKEHVEQELSSCTLLRASDGSTPPDTLLRPVAETVPASPGHLLRPGSPPEHPGVRR